MGDRRIEGITLGNLALLHHDQGHNPETLECYSQALAIHREVGSRLYEGNILGGLALYHHDQGNIPEALEHYSRALAIHREVGNRRFEGVALGNLGDLLSSQGDLQSAEASLRGAIAIGDETLPVAAGAFRGSLALIRAQQGALDEARELLEMGESQVRGVYQLELGKLLCKKARVEHLAGDPSASATALAEAESIADELKIGPESDLGQLIVEAREAISG
jgi:tetratricopeptide (TPR) repeat protein